MNQKIKLLNDEITKFKLNAVKNEQQFLTRLQQATADLDFFKNQKNISLEPIIKKLENDIEQKNNEILALKNKTVDTTIITKLNEVIENQNNELKSLNDKYKNACEENERLKFENIELQAEINNLIKTDDDSDYTSNYDTEEESDEQTEQNNIRPFLGFTQRKMRQPTQEFFDKLLIEQQNKKEKEPVIKEPPNYSFSTDYHVDMLQNSNKLIPRDERIYYNDTQRSNNLLKDIFIKNEAVKEPVRNNNNSLEIIINDKQNNNIIINDENKENNNNIFEQGSKILAKSLQIGGKNKNRFTIHDIEGTLKMYINNDFSTITEQNIDKNDLDLGRKIYNRKNVRRSRNKNN